MASDQSSLTTDFLNDAAHLLRQSLPETSAHLMSERAQVLAKRGILPSDTERQHVCVACGHIMVPGQHTQLSLEARKMKRKRKNDRKGPEPAPAPATAATGPQMLITCGHCSSDTRVALPAPGQAFRRKSNKKAAAAPKPEIQEKTAPSANASSKKRAKNRKAGLQALLSSQKQPSSSLSLANFMQKG